MRTLGKIIATTSRPDENVVSEVPDVPVRFLSRRRKAFAKKRNVLMIPRIAVRERGSVGDSRNLVAIIPPRHDARVFRRVVAKPPIRLTVVVDYDRLAVAETGLVHDARLRHALGNTIGVVVKPSCDKEKHKNGSTRGDATKSLPLFTFVKIDVWMKIQNIHESFIATSSLRSPLLLCVLHLPLSRHLFTSRGSRSISSIAVDRIIARHCNLSRAPVAKPIDRYGASNRRNGSHEENKTHHFSGEEVGERCVEDQEKARVAVHWLAQLHEEPNGREPACSASTASRLLMTGWCSATLSTSGLPVLVCCTKRPRMRLEIGPKYPVGASMLTAKAPAAPAAANTLKRSSVTSLGSIFFARPYTATASHSCSAPKIPNAPSCSSDLRGVQPTTGTNVAPAVPIT